MITTGGFVGLAIVPFGGAIGARAWVHVGITTVLHGVYYATLLGAYARGDLSHVYPIARGLGPVLVALTSFAASESLGVLEWLGLALVASGLFLLASPAFTAGEAAAKRARAATGYAVATGVLIGAYSINDGLGSRAAEDPIAYVGWLQVCTSLPFAIYALARKGRTVVTLPRKEILRGIGGGLLGMGAYGIALLAARQGKLAHVAALRETSVVFAAIIGARMLKEPVGKLRFGAAALVAIGLVVMHLGA